LCNYIAVLPIIVYFSKKKDIYFVGVGLAFFYGFCGIFAVGRNLADFYPITSGLGLLHYTNIDLNTTNPMIGISTLIFMILLSFIILLKKPNYEKVTSPSDTKPKDGK
jgi:bacitracin transport system permease protein